MFGAVDAGLIMELARLDGVMYQQEMYFEPHVFVDPKYFTSEPNGYSMIQHGQTRGSLGSQDHPYFASTRDMLEHNGYIKCERSWHNGDRVLKPFYFNNVYMNVGEKFSSATAMSHGRYVEFYNDGEILNRYIDEDVYLNEKYPDENI